MNDYIIVTNPEREQARRLNSQSYVNFVQAVVQFVPVQYVLWPSTTNP